MIQQLVVNGCSYTHSYAVGNGHEDLAQRLGIDQSSSIAVSGSANTRIIRTTLKHSYQPTVPTLSVLGMTFLSRVELPICEPEDDFEGRWCNPQNQEFKQRWQYGWDDQDQINFVDLKLKTEVFSILDRTEDLMYRIVSMISDLESRGHKVLVFQQADNLYQSLLPQLNPNLFDRKNIVGGYAWRATEYQMKQGVPPKQYSPGSLYVPPDMCHPAIGQHQVLNEFLTNYIKDNKIIS